MKKIVASTLILSTALLVGCTSNEPVNPEQPPVGNESQQPVETSINAKQIYPLKEGNYWKYQLSGQDSQFMEQKVMFVEGDKVQIQEVDTSTTKAVIYEYQEDGNKLVATNLLEEFYDETNILSQKGKMNNVILQGPYEVGSTWENNGLTYTITSLEEKVSTPAGDFTSCITVHATDGNDSFNLYTYYQPEIGIVKEVSGEGEYKVEKVLVEYDLKGNE